ncbi:MAG: type 4a pilus biogenesis protein PilO [Planctomycetota bacterium]
MSARTLDYIIQAIAVLALVICGLATFYVLHSPPAGQLEADHGQQSAASSAGHELPEVRSALRQADKELQQGHAYARELRERIPDGPNEADFLKQLSGAAEASGLKIQDYRRGGSAVKESYSSLQINLICSARYVQLCRFLEQLDELPRILTIEKLTISTPDDGDEYPVDLSLSVYFRGQQQPSEKDKAQSNG